LNGSPRRVDPWMVLVLVATSALALSKLVNYDIWLYLKAADTILEGGQLPKLNAFSYSVPPQPWQNPYWLSCLVFRSAWGLAGICGLTIFKALVVIALFVVVYSHTTRRCGLRWMSALIVLFALLTARPRFMARPNLFSLFFFAVFLNAIDRGRHNPRALWYLPAAMILWANLHPGFPLGIVVVGLTAILDRRFRRSGLSLLPLLLVGAMCNSYGVTNLFYWTREVHNDFFRLTIAEHRPVPFESGWWPFWAMFVAAIVVSGDSLLRRRWYDASVVILFGLMPLYELRHVGLFAIAASPVLASAFAQYVTSARELTGELFHRRQRLQKHLGWGAVWLTLIGTLAVLSHQAYRTFGIGLFPGRVPVKAVNFILCSKAPGRIFCPFWWSSYVLWRAWPERQVHLTGLAPLYSPRLYMEEALVTNGHAIGEEVLDRCRADVLLLRNTDAGRDFERWKTVYWDDTAVVYVRRTAPSPWKDLASWDLTHPERIGLYMQDAALIPMIVRQLRTKIHSDSRCWLAHRNLATAFMCQGDFQSATSEWDRALMLRPRDALALHNLGYCYYRLGDMEKALGFLCRAASVAHQADAATFEAMGDCLARLGQTTRARRAYERALYIDPHLRSARTALARLRTK